MTRTSDVQSNLSLKTRLLETASPIAIACALGWCPLTAVAGEGGKAVSKAEVAAIVREVAAAHHINPDDFEREAVIESGLNSRAYNKNSKAAGVFQFIPSTAKHYGLVDPYETKAAAEAAAKLWEDNRKALEQALGVEPTAGMQYVAHQQGCVGAVKLLTNPNAPAYKIVGKKAVTLNGGRLGMSAKEFANMWIERFKSTRLPTFKEEFRAQ